MVADVPAAPASCLAEDVRPPITSFSPSMWGDIFSSYSVDDEVQEKYGKAIEEMKEETRSLLLMAKENKSSCEEILLLIDTLERLGVAYHFEEEIEKEMEQIFKLINLKSDNEAYINYHDLFTTALQFRLLRQHRHNAPCDVFDKFKNDELINENLHNDAKGLLSLYQAAQLRMHGENFLEEAVAFTNLHLNRMLILHNDDDDNQILIYGYLRDEIEQALQQSLHRGVPRIESLNYISIYEKYDSKNEMLLKFAKLDFNFLQNLYKKELCHLTRWWNNFDLKSKLPHARDRLVECYFWAMTCHFEPQYSWLRIALAKRLQMVATIDDTYDNYATLEEAKLFTDILQRWDMKEIDGLPDYMKIVYGFVLSIYEDYERDAAEQQKLFAIPYAKEGVKELVRAYYKELKWFVERDMPTFDDYVSNTISTSCINLFYTTIIPGMKSVSKETIDWLFSKSNKMVVAMAKTVRFLDDLGTYEREKKEGKMLTAIDCYMNHYGVSKEEAMEKFGDLIQDGWKDVNKEWISSTSCSSVVPKEFFEGLLNYVRAGEVVYKNSGDGMTNPGKLFASQIVALFVDPIVIV